MRKLATAAAVSLALASGGAFGLGLGDIEMRSALNQPMNAEIRLTSVKSGELDGMIVQLASPDAFARAGIERSTALTDLRFTVDQSSGVPVIRISSQRPVVEPFLNFLLEVDWPQGRMVREYTVLLDPPVFMTPSATQRNTTADQPAVVQRGNEALVLPTPIERAAEQDTGLVAEEGFEVELVGLEEETADQAGGDTAAADQGEIVSLDSLTDSELLAESEPVSSAQGDVVSLTDLNAPNTAALEARELEAQQAFDLDAIEVELVGSSEEVADSTVIDGVIDRVVDGSASDVTTDALDEDGSTIVSLDDLALDESVTAGGSTAQTSATEVNVATGDTLFEIAQDNAVDGVSVQQMMMALLAANESAFINNNINLVRAGAILRIPDAGEATRLTQTQALAAIGQQNQLWQEYRDTLRNSGVTQVASDSSGQSDTATTQASDTTAIDTAALDSELASDKSVDGLSEDARTIIENARNEILNREELRIVADNAPTSTAASATADETDNSDAQRLGEINRRLQLAREELSSTRLQSEDLSEQASELQDTGENLDALVTLRQNEIAQLEAQLADARQASEAAAEATDTVTGTSADTATDTAAGSVTDAATDAAAGAAESVTAAAGAAATAIDAAAETSSGALSTAGDAAGEVVDSGTNALTEAGETLAQVELLGDESDNAANPSAGSDTADADAVIAPPVKQTTWYQDFLDDPKRMMIAGIGGIGLLGVLGTLLFRRKRRDDDELLDIGDDVEFVNDEEAGQQADTKKQSGDGLNLSAAGTAGAAAVGGAAASTMTSGDEAEQETLSSTFDEMADSGLPQDSNRGADHGYDLGSETQAVADATGDDGIDKDDTLSEVDVYLAYGLHGQAEELLTKAIERNPNNPEYAQKLLQTYHAQGNGEGFHQTAKDFHGRFGGESNPRWPAIAAMGADLRPGDALYASARDAITAIGAGNSDGMALGDDDFLPAHDTETGSVSRNFRDSKEAVDLEDESPLMEESLDPAFAFDESDLEATGDFSDITGEISSEDADSIDFPEFDANANGADADQPDLTGDLTDELSAGLSEADPLLGDALTIEELDRVASADDLTLDLDQLSGDLELDSAELMNSDLSDLDLPDLTADNDLLLDDSGAGDSADEMDTMLDLAKAYIDMGDKDSASSALGEIVKSGSPEQVTEAETLLRKIS